MLAENKFRNFLASKRAMYILVSLCVALIAVNTLLMLVRYSGFTVYCNPVVALGSEHFYRICTVETFQHLWSFSTSLYGVALP